MYHIDEHHKVTPKIPFIIESPKKNSRTLEGVVTERDYPIDGLFPSKALTAEHSRSASKKTAEKILE